MTDETKLYAADPPPAICRPGLELPADRLRPVLDRLAGLPPVRLRVRRVSLVRIAPGADGPGWHTVAGLPLGVRFTP